MQDVQIQLAALWIGVELLYLYGDMLRIFSYDWPDVADTRHIGKRMWLGAAILMSVPIIMIPVALMMPYEINRWLNIVVAGFFFLFILGDMRSYPSAYDRYLFVVSMVFNVITIVLAWNWVAPV
jgi:hypothetical protein